MRDDVRQMQPERSSIRGFKGEVHAKFSHRLLFTLMLLRCWPVKRRDKHRQLILVVICEMMCRLNVTLSVGLLLIIAKTPFLEQASCKSFSKVSEVEKKQMNGNHLRKEGFFIHSPKMYLFCGCVEDPKFKKKKSVFLFVWLSLFIC